MEVINSFFSNIKDKLTNPYFGTLILVLIIHHWELWYTLFNFDDDCTLQDKITFVREYLENNLTFRMFMWDVFQSIILMFLGYLIIVGTRSLAMWVEFGLMPLITGKIVNKNVVRRSEYDDVVKEREEYFDQYEEQRKNVRAFSKTIDEQTEQIKIKDENLLEQSKTISQTVKELDLTKKKLEKSQSEHEKSINELKLANDTINTLKHEKETKIKQVDYFTNIFFSPESMSFFNSADKFPPIIIDKVTELKEVNKWQAFLSLGSFFENGGTIGGKTLTEMIEKDIAFERGSREEFTPIGKIIWKYRNVFENYEVY
ncbi:hypothetical protein [Flavobacterium macrobrachii]|uniref:hypothetical protein n=1 Tax=Flavobacterium macrobrachii TaxID=591204 RepID=UPI003F71ADCC